MSDLFCIFRTNGDTKRTRIPTPVNFNSGRKSATELSVHSEWSHDAAQSNMTGLSTHELRLHDMQQKDEEQERQRRLQERRKLQDESRHNAEQQMIQNKYENQYLPEAQQDIYFKYGSYGKSNKSSINKRSSPTHNNISAQQQNSPEKLNKSLNNLQLQSNENHRYMQQSINTRKEVQPHVPSRRKGGYHRSKADLSPAALMQPPGDRNDSGIEIADPESPSSGSLKSSAADSSR